MIRVLLADDQALVRGGFRSLLETEDGIEVVGEAGDGRLAVNAVRDLRPDVVLMDIGLPGLDGYRLAQRLRSAGLKTFLVALTGYGLGEDKNRARDAGFNAHLTKPAPMAQLLKLVAEAAQSPAELATWAARARAAAE